MQSIVIGGDEATEHNLEGAHMAKHITKSVIEDIAYELKRAGLHYVAWQMGEWPEEAGKPLANPENMLSYIIEQMEQVFLEHDPTFNHETWVKQTEYKTEY